MSRAPPLILMGGEDEEDGAQGVCVTPTPPQMKCTQSHTVISVHCMAWIQRAGQFHDYAKGNV